jgi:hypothetical protein
MMKETSNRRGFLRQGAKFGLAAAIAATGVKQAVAQIPSSELDLITPGDIAILQFLAAAEALENDLWQQYTELSQGNFVYQAALQKVIIGLTHQVLSGKMVASRGNNCLFV